MYYVLLIRLRESEQLKTIDVYCLVRTWVLYGSLTPDLESAILFKILEFYSVFMHKHVWFLPEML